MRAKSRTERLTVATARRCGEFRPGGIHPFPTADAPTRRAGNGDLQVALDNHTVVGWCVLEHSFFEEGLIPTLRAADSHRRQGIATALAGRARRSCRTRRLWTSTTLSNHPLQWPRRKLDWRLSGVLHYLGPDDTELVFVHLGPGESEQPA